MDKAFSFVPLVRVSDVSRRYFSEGRLCHHAHDFVQDLVPSK